jgi:hypothetical protein
VVFYEEVIHPAATEVVRGNAYSSRERPSRRRPLWRPSFGPCPSFSRSGAHRRRRRTLDARADAARRAGETSDLLSRETERKTSRDEIEALPIPAISFYSLSQDPMVPTHKSNGIIGRQARN